MVTHIASVLLLLVIASPLLVWLFPAQHYADGEPTRRHRPSCRQCRHNG